MKRRKHCKHCDHTPANAPRGLCWVCYRNKEVRRLHGVSTRSGVEDFNGKAREPESTMTLPGTQDKVAVLMERARRGESLWHRKDAERD